MFDEETISQENILSRYEFDPASFIYKEKTTDKHILLCTFGNALYPIRISSLRDEWTTIYNNRELIIGWHNFDVNDQIKKSFKEFLKVKLHKNSPLYVETVAKLLTSLCKLKEFIAFENATVENLRTIWDKLGHDRKLQSTFRQSYMHFASNSMIGASPQLARIMSDWKSSGRRDTLIDVQQWHATRGSFTLNEWEVVLSNIHIPIDRLPKSDLSPSRLLARIFLWICTLCGKRPVQILGAEKNSIIELTNEWILLIPPAKKQKGRKQTSVVIQDSDLIQMIQHYSEIPEISNVQTSSNRLLVSPNMTSRGLKTETINEFISQWWHTQHAPSDRSGIDKIHLTSYRIRHTVATQMAMNGTPKSSIAAFLEHDSEESCQAYINAVHTDICAELNKVDVNMDSVFTNLDKAYFEGVIQPEVEPKKGIYIPQGEKSPLLVGTCGKNVEKEGICNKHPFIACYGGCRSFRPWRDGPHVEAKRNIESELRRFERQEFAINFSSKHILALKTAAQGVDAVLDSIADRDNSSSENAG